MFSLLADLTLKIIFIILITAQNESVALFWFLSSLILIPLPAILFQTKFFYLITACYYDSLFLMGTWMLVENFSVEAQTFHMVTHTIFSDFSSKILTRCTRISRENSYRSLRVSRKSTLFTFNNWK